MKPCLPFLASVLVLMTAAPGADSASAAGELVIVAPKALAPALDDFLAWKKSLMPARLAVLEEVLAGSTGVDEPERLKRWLYGEWQAKRVTHVLLAGDVDVFPVRYMVLDRITPAAFNYSFYPSDLYYADLAKADGSFDDWNARRDGFHASYFGEVRGEANKQDPINYDDVDYLPDIAVGRWPVSTADELKRVAAKSAAVERRILDDRDPGLRRAAMVAVDGWVDARGQLRRLTGLLSPAWQTEQRFYGTDTPPATEQIRRILNEGAGLMIHTGHGNPDRWEQCLTIGDLSGLKPADAIPVVMSAGCSTAHFAPLPPYEPYIDRDGKKHAGTDRGEQFTEPPPPPAVLQPAPVNPTCLGEALLKRADSGAVAYIGCNTGSQPPGLSLVDGFVRTLADSDTPRVGDCWNGAIRYYVRQERLRELKPTESWVPPSIFFQGMKFMLFGDPSLRMPGRKRG